LASVISRWLGRRPRASKATASPKEDQMPKKVPKSSKKTKAPVMKGVVIAIRPKEGIIVLRADDGTEHVLDNMDPHELAGVRIGEVHGFKHGTARVITPEESLFRELEGVVNDITRAIAESPHGLKDGDPLFKLLDKVSEAAGDLRDLIAQKAAAR
jgi:hypothetical protein